MTETKYKIASICYTKPGITKDGNGESFAYRYAIWYTVGEVGSYTGQYVGKVVERIEYDGRSKQFMIYFAKGGLKTIPLLSDTEVLYEEVVNKTVKEKK